MEKFECCGQTTFRPLVEMPAKPTAPAMQGKAPYPTLLECPRCGTHYRGMRSGPDVVWVRV
jgi:hypothetical protein